MVIDLHVKITFNLQIPQDEFIIDQTGRQSQLSTYIQFQCKIPHPVYGNKSAFVLSRSSDDIDTYSTNSELQSGAEMVTNAFDNMRTSESIDFDNYSPIRLLHEEIALHWCVAGGNSAEIAMTNSWFLFELMIKSMIEHLDATKTLNAPRKSRFPHQYVDDLATLIGLVTAKVVQFHGTDVKAAQSLNASLAFFVFDMLSVMDRGFIFGLIKSYYKLMASKILTNPDLVHYKLDFLRIVCSHEHYVALNLPFATPYTMVSAPCSPTPSVTSNNSQTSYLSTVVSIRFDSSHVIHITSELIIMNIIYRPA